jgi:hypothetical protein
MALNLNCDSQPIRNYEITPEGFMKLWIAAAVANKDMIYDSGTEKRTEFINLENLQSKDSINSLIGKPVTFNHPPQAINGNNWRENMVGVAMQEYAIDGDALLMATMIYDSQVIADIKAGKIAHTSSGYTAAKAPLNQDGKIEQLQRAYNHIALLDSSHVPRAGAECSIRAFELPQKDSKTETTQTNMSNNSDSGVKDSGKKELFPENNLQEMIELHTQYDSILKDNGKEPDFKMSASELKRAVLNCYYPPEQISKLNDSNLDGFWINFELNKELILDSIDTRNQEVKSSKQQDDNSSSRETFIAMMEGRK